MICSCDRLTPVSPDCVVLAQADNKIIDANIKMHFLMFFIGSHCKVDEVRNIVVAQIMP